jgi:hypothetical protein
LAGPALRAKAGTNKYQVFFRAPAGEGEPWKRVLRRAASEDEARKIFAQAEAALGSEQGMPVGAEHFEAYVPRVDWATALFSTLDGHATSSCIAGS